MARLVEEWIGKTDDAAIPGRVKLRISDRSKGCCAICTLPIGGKLLPVFDHTIALVNGGENREANLRLVCVPCHKNKTAADVGEKRINNRVRLKHLGIKKRKGRPMPGSRASGIKMKFGGGWERR